FLKIADILARGATPLGDLQLDDPGGDGPRLGRGDDDTAVPPRPDADRPRADLDADPLLVLGLVVVLLAIGLSGCFRLRIHRHLVLYLGGAPSPRFAGSSSV